VDRLGMDGGRWNATLPDSRVNLLLMIGTKSL